MQPIVRHAVKISYHLTTVRQCGILVRASQVKRTAVISYRRLTQSLADTWAGSGGRWVKAGAVGLVRGNRGFGWTCAAMVRRGCAGDTEAEP